MAEQITDTHFGKRVVLSHKPVPDTGVGYDLNIHGHFHNIERIRHEPELAAIASPKQVLLAVEHSNYEPVALQRIVEGRYKPTGNL